MQVENEVFEKQLPEDLDWEDQVFRFCTFKGIDAEGTHVTSAFIDCRFEGCDFYWALFNIATFVGVSFKDCYFRGGGFAECRMVECTFENCHFTLDNLGGDCRFDGSRWYGCTQRGTEGLSEALVAS